MRLIPLHPSMYDKRPSMPLTGYWNSFPDSTRDDANAASFGVAALLQNDSSMNEIVDSVHFSHRLIPTYHLSLVTILLALTIREWMIKFIRKRRRTASQTPGADSNLLSYDRQGKSDCSYRFTGDNTTTSRPSKNEDEQDERAHLLGASSIRPQPSALRKVYFGVQSAAIYQPPALPVVNKILPSNATSLSVLFFFGLNAFYLVYKVDFTFELAFVWADRASLLFVANLPWLYLLAAKNQPIKFLTGRSYENLNIIHRRLGEWMCAIAILHFVGMVFVWYHFLRPIGWDLMRFLSTKAIWLGIGAWTCYELLYLTSLASFREWWYELFLGSHIVLQAGGLVFVFFHHPNGRVYTAMALAIFLVDRLVYRLGLKSRCFQADFAVMEDGETILVSVDWPLTSRWSTLGKSLFCQDVGYGWKPAEHVFLTVPGLASKHAVQAHPFTIASAAPERDGRHAWLNLIVRIRDGFTKDLAAIARQQRSSMVRLDGPYGSLHALEMLRDGDTSILIAGGSGIAVAYPLIWSLLHDRNLDAENGRSSRQVCLIWVVHAASHILWIGQERLNELKDCGLHIVLPPPSETAGRPDIAGLLDNTVRDLTNDDTHRRVRVVVSGPDGMNRAVRNACASMAWQGRDVDVTVEKFGW